MIKVIPNQVVCKNCMAKLEYESSDVIKIFTKYPNIEIEPDDDILVNGYEEVSQKYIECPICKTKIIL
jgi:DNA-directed RNA polymerase subunit RPC12/RpoP